jgi:hypothetical protein
VQQQKGRIARLRAAGVDTWDAQKILRCWNRTFGDLRNTETASEQSRAPADRTVPVIVLSGSFEFPAPVLPGSFATKTRLLSITGSVLPPVVRNDSDIQKTRSRLAPKGGGDDGREADQRSADSSTSEADTKSHSVIS